MHVFRLVSAIFFWPSFHWSTAISPDSEESLKRATVGRSLYSFPSWTVEMVTGDPSKSTLSTRGSGSSASWIARIPSIIRPERSAAEAAASISAPIDENDTLDCLELCQSISGRRVQWESGTRCQIYILCGRRIASLAIIFGCSNIGLLSPFLGQT